MVNMSSVTWQTFKFDDLDKSLLYSILELRQEVFVVEQTCAYRDLDRLDQAASHIICIYNDNPIAYARALPPPKDSRYSSLGRIVVCHDHRGTGIGSDLVKRSIKHNLQAWTRCKIRISAQTYLIDFYRAFGFKAKGYEYLEDGIPHIQMVLANEVWDESLM